jgi:prolipoprotein diacylglyceryltransferase
MPGLYTTFGPVTVQTFTFFVTLAVFAGVGLSLYRAGDRRGALADVYLLALVLAVMGARAGHVLLNWEHFAYNLSEIARVNTGGLDWHGAVIGALMGLVIGTHWRKLAYSALLASLTLALPLIALAGWWGCWASNCGFGAEVDTLARYPAWMVSEAPDVYGIPAPRYNTQFFGLLLGLAALLIAVVLLWRGWQYDKRFWILLAFLSAGMFAIGFVRGDYTVMILGLRADQWLDLGLLLFAFFMLITRKPQTWQT